MGGRGGELAWRIAVAAVGIPLVVVFVYLGGFFLAGLLATIAAIAAWEFCRMHASGGSAADPVVAAALALVYVLLAAVLDPGDYLVAAVVVSLFAAGAISVGHAPESRPGRMVITTVFAAVYSGVMLAFAIWLRALAEAPGLEGAAIVFLPVAITWLGDTAAYFVGKGVGRHRFAPRISPKKTWEGAIGGLVATAGGAVLWLELTKTLAPWTMGVAEALLFGTLVSTAGQIGDLFESRFKRECGVKDSSALLPGHGGMLDRADSLLFVFPVAYAYLKVMGV